MQLTILTLCDGRKLAVNPEHVVSVVEADNETRLKYDGVQTLIYTRDDPENCLLLKQNFQQVVLLLVVSSLAKLEGETTDATDRPDPV